MRQQLPNRRLSVTKNICWQFDSGVQSFHITFGRDPKTLEVREVFYADGQKSGSQLQYAIQDACILLSLLLQHQAEPLNIGKSLGQIELMGQMRPASVLGVIIEALEEEIDATKDGEEEPTDP